MVYRKSKQAAASTDVWDKVASTSEHEHSDVPRDRVNKYIADRGVCSRRDADLWIESGRVTINDVPASPGDFVSASDQVRVDGELLGLHAKPRRVYIALNKPVGIECTTNQEVDGNIVDFVGHSERIFPIGRLDKDSDGLILLTNDGDVVNRMLRKEFNHEKEYVVSVERKIGNAELQQMSQGVPILRRMTRPCKTYKLAAQTFGIVLTEGMNRQIRRMADVVGHRVVRLTRVRMLNITLGHLKPGKWRNLTPAEITELQKRLDAQPAAAKKADMKKLPEKLAKTAAEKVLRGVRGDKPGRAKVGQAIATPARVVKQNKARIEAVAKAARLASKSTRPTREATSKVSFRPGIGPDAGARVGQKAGSRGGTNATNAVREGGARRFASKKPAGPNAAPRRPRSR